MRKSIVLLFLLGIGFAKANLNATPAPSLRPFSSSEVCMVYTSEEPYQYIQDKGGIKAYRGVDVDILTEILRPGRGVNYKHLNWSRGLAALKKGECDFVLGAFYAQERTKYAYYSSRYRLNHDTFYHLANKPVEATSVQALFEKKEKHPTRLGVINKMRYTSDVINQQINDNPKKFIFANNNQDLIQLLIDNKIEGFFVDKMQMELLLWRSELHSKIIASKLKMGIEPVHFLMSKKTVTPEFVAWFNGRLNSFKQTPEYSNILRTYSVPLFIAMLTDGWMYRLLEILGTIFYAISGLVLARKAKFSLAGAFILAMLPGIGGGLLRDVILSRDPVGILRTPLFFMTVVLTTLAFYFFIRLRSHINFLHKISDYFHDHMFVKEFSIVQATDAVGLAVFTIIGVLTAVEAQATPLWLWGPMIGVLSSTGGGIIRDFFMGEGLIRTFFYEMSLAWSALLTYYIISHTNNITATEIERAIIFTFFGILLTRIIVLKMGWKTKDFWSN